MDYSPELLAAQALFEQRKRELAAERAAAGYSPRPRLAHFALPSPDELPAVIPSPTKPTTVRAYSGLMAAVLRADHQAPAARVWLLLRAHDRPGRGMVEVTAARELLASKRSPWRVMGWRRLRQILAAGDGLFWHRHGGRLRLASPARVVAALDGQSLGRPVLLPVAALLGGIGEARAAMFAATFTGKWAGRPISRATIRRISGVPEATQRVYSRRGGLNAQRNYALSPIRWDDQAARQELAHRQAGRPVLPFVDWPGRMGKPRETLCAWPLPKSYTTSYDAAPKGRMRKDKKQLNALVSYAARGTGRRPPVEYHADLEAAALAAVQRPRVEHLAALGTGPTVDASRRPRLRGVRVWRVVELSA